MDLNSIGNLIVIAIKNVFWWILTSLTNVLALLLDFIAFLLPNYTIPVPSVYFGHNPVIPFLNWIFPVDHFLVCVNIIVLNMGISFAYGPLLRIVRVAK